MFSEEKKDYFNFHNILIFHLSFYKSSVSTRGEDPDPDPLDPPFLAPPDPDPLFFYGSGSGGTKKSVKI